MDIEENRPQDKPATSIRTHLSILIRSRDFTLKKALLLLNKHFDRSALYAQLDSLYQQINQVSYLANLLIIVQHYLTLQGEFNCQNDEKIRWLIGKIHQIRLEIDKTDPISEDSLEVLNKLLNIMNNLVIFFGKASAKNVSKLDQCSLFQHEMISILQLSTQSGYFHAINHLFDINLLLKMADNRLISFSFLELLKNNIFRHFDSMQNNLPNCSQPTKEILINTILKCSRTIKGFHQYIAIHLQNIFGILEVRSKLLLLCELKCTNLAFISAISCENEQEFQLMSLAIHQCSTSPDCDLSNLSEIWIRNLFYLTKSEIDIDLYPIVAQLEDSFLIVVYTKIGELFNTLKTPEDINHLIIIWGKLLLTDKVYQLVLHNKSIAINVQLLLYQFIREILQILDAAIGFHLYPLVMKVYSKYYGELLKQEECLAIHHQAILLIIRQYPEFLNEAMILASTAPKCTDRVNLENYRGDYVSELAKYCVSNNRIACLDVLDKKVSKILLKYLIDKNIIPLTAILNQNDVIAYTIENDIELHLDIYEHLLQQKFYDNIQIYLTLVSKCHSKNRYRNMIDTCCLNLLLNELEDNSNRKLIKINEALINLLTQNLPFLLNISAERDINPRIFFNAIFALIVRSLYYNAPLAANFLLMVTLALKRQTIGSELLAKEAQLAHELAKFCKMFCATHKSYFLLGFTALTMLLYGLPCVQQHSINQNLSLILQENGYFLQSVIQNLSGELQIIDSCCHRTENQLPNEPAFEIALKKCLNVGFIRHLTHVITTTENFGAQIRLFNSFIEEIMGSEASKSTNEAIKAPFDLKKRNGSPFEDYEEEQSVPVEQVEDDARSLNFILKQYQKYDEFIEYRLLQKQMAMLFAEKSQQAQRLLHSSRVHGKIRTILHVNK